MPLTPDQLLNHAQLPQAPGRPIRKDEIELHERGLYIESWLPERRSRRKPLLFIHGELGGSWTWERYLGYFATRGWEGHALNLRNHHWSQTADATTLSFDTYTEDVVAARVGINHVLDGQVGPLADFVTNLARVKRSVRRVNDDDAALADDEAGCSGHVEPRVPVVVVDLFRHPDEDVGLDLGQRIASAQRPGDAANQEKGEDGVRHNPSLFSSPLFLGHEPFAN